MFIMVDGRPEADEIRRKRSLVWRQLSSYGIFKTCLLGNSAGKVEIPNFFIFADLRKIRVKDIPWRFYVLPVISASIDGGQRGT